MVTKWQVSIFDRYIKPMPKTRSWNTRKNVTIQYETNWITKLKYLAHSYKIIRTSVMCQCPPWILGCKDFSKHFKSKYDQVWSDQSIDPNATSFSHYQAFCVTTCSGEIQMFLYLLRGEQVVLSALSLLSASWTSESFGWTSEIFFVSWGSNC